MKFLKCLAATALIVAASCGGGGGDYVGGPSGGGTTGGTSGGTQTGGSTSPVVTNAVSVSDNIFAPINAQVSVGATVTWTWSSGASAHNVTFSDGQTSGDKSGGGTFSRTFNTAGTFNYHCTIHPGMDGSIIVQ
jgi:plastocyanin